MDSARVVEVDGFGKLHCFPTENSKELIYFVLFKNKISQPFQHINKAKVSFSIAWCH